MRIAMLGTLQVYDDADQPVHLPGPRLRILLARLALDEGRPVTADALINTVWPDTPPAGATNALQSLVTRLRRHLPGTAPVVSVAGGYRLDAPRGSIDVTEFEYLLSEGGHGEDGHGSAAPTETAAKGALRLWRGEPFAGLAEHPTFTVAAARLAELRLRAVAQVVAADLAAGGGGGRVGELADLVAAHPLREDLRALHMRALLAAGRPAQALASYEELRRILATELGTDPAAAVREVHLAILRADQPGRSTDAEDVVPRRPVPTALASFVGRTTELAHLTRVLADGRLVSLVGPGGAGKTRLAAELAARYPVDAWVVELAGVGDPLEVPGAVLTAVGGADTGLLRGGPADPMRRLVAALGDRPVLLVLDNCEHQLDACARLAEAVLGHCPGVRVLVTTREPLAITGEILCPLGPLPVPSTTMDLDGAMAVDAMRLFVDRARAVRPGFALTEENVAAVAEICRRLDGLPLAIELACARLRTAAVPDIAARLGDRFRLLTGGSRTALPRHQTLAAVIDWSWATFTPTERVLARRLSVFAGGTTPEAAEAVCADAELAAPDVVDVLGALVDKSFVQLIDVAGQPPRYRMLDTIRAYASAALADAGESESVREAHARYFRDVAEAAEPVLRGHDQLRWLAWFRREYDNLTTALRWAVDAGDTDLAVRLAVATGWYWVLAGSSGEATAWLREVLGLPGLDRVAPSRLALAYAYDSIHHVSVQDLGHAARSATAARVAARGSDPHAPPADDEHPAVAVVSAIIQINAFDLPTAIAGLARLVDHPDRWAAAVGELMRGHAAETGGDAPGAQRHFGRSREMFAATGDRWGVMMALNALANVDSLAGESAAALESLAEAERYAAEVGADDDLEWTRARRGFELSRRGDVAAARSVLLRSYETGLARDRATLIAISASWLADLARRDGDLDGARDRLTSAVDRLDGALGALIPRLRIMCQIGLARVAAAAGDPRAAAHADEALTAALLIGDRSMLATIAEVMAEVAVARADHAAAARHLGLAAATRGVPDRGSPDVLAVEHAARAALGTATYQRGYTAAAGLSPGEAVAAIAAARAEPDNRAEPYSRR